jgi:hypothetical protein
VVTRVREWWSAWSYGLRMAWLVTCFMWVHRHHRTRHSEGRGFDGYWCSDCRKGLVVPL